MRTNLRSRSRGLVLAALTVIVSLPELARAQQTGLFPLAPIKRQRVPCDQEDPIYKTYKNQYFGYHPTCWRAFPTGWGCPSPNGPDKEKSFKEFPPTAGERTDAPMEGEPEEGMGAQPGGTRPAVPALPPATRSPFEDPFDTDKPATPPRNPRGGQAPLPTPPAGDPFDLDRPDAPAAPRPGQPRPAAPGDASNGPPLSAPADQPGSIQGARSSQGEAPDEPSDREDRSPLLALPSVDLPPVGDPGVPFGTQPPAPAADVAANANTTPPAAALTPRRSFLSGLFNNLGLNWARR
jgi:hypothetical protein